jgi:hypothetical protein
MKNCLFCNSPTDRVGTMFDYDDTCRRCRVAFRTVHSGYKKPKKYLMVWKQGTWLKPPDGTLVVKPDINPKKSWRWNGEYT